MIKVGCCGFCVSREKYFKNFKVIELQQTFYQLPKIETVLKLKNSAPSDFEFTLKANQVITHPTNSLTYRKYKEQIKNPKNYGFFKPTDEVFEAWERTSQIAKILNAKIIVFQSPASFLPEQENIKNLKNFFKKVKREDFVFCWEPRGNWSQDLILDLCKDLDLVHCVDPFKNKQVFGEINYFRLHGRSCYKYSYNKEDLETLKSFIDKDIAYVMFNNTNMFEDANEFKKYLS